MTKIKLKTTRVPYVVLMSFTSVIFSSKTLVSIYIIKNNNLILLGKTLSKCPALSVRVYAEVI